MGILTFPPAKGAASYPSWVGFLDALNDGAGGDYYPGSNTTNASDIYRCRNINIPAGVVSAQHGEWIIFLATEDIVIDGTLTASGKGKAAGTTTNGGAGGGGGGGGYTSRHSDGDGYAGSGGATSYAQPTQSPGGVGGVSTDRNGRPGTGGSNAVNFGLFPYDQLTTVLATVGAGGGRGGSVRDGSNGGAGGAGGGNIVIMTRGSIRGSGAIRADGLAGANSGNVSAYDFGAGGGGGGGGGGSVILVAKSITLPTITANGGAGGVSGTGSQYIGGTGGAGGNGMVVKMILPR
jgi:hypothetical protein